MGGGVETGMANARECNATYAAGSQLQCPRHKTRVTDLLHREHHLGRKDGVFRREAASQRTRRIALGDLRNLRGVEGAPFNHTSTPITYTQRPPASGCANDNHVAALLTCSARVP